MGSVTNTDRKVSSDLFNTDDRMAFDVTRIGRQLCKTPLIHATRTSNKQTSHLILDDSAKFVRPEHEPSNSL